MAIDDYLAKFLTENLIKLGELDLDALLSPVQTKNPETKIIPK